MIAPLRLALVVALATLSAVLAAVVLAARSGPDPSFGNNGVTVVDDLPIGINLDLAQDSKGRLIAVGGDVFTVARFRWDGSLDPSFGDEGVVQPIFKPTAGGDGVALQPDGRILVAGHLGARGEEGFALVRYLPDGRLDSSFGGNGRVRTAFGRYGRIQRGVGSERGIPNAVAIQEQGRILVAGRAIRNVSHETGVLVGYKPNGAIDKQFGDEGVVRFRAPDGYAQLGDLKVLPSGKLLVSGTTGGSLLLARLHSTGRLDRSFGGGDGRVVTPVSQDFDLIAGTLGVQPSGRIVVEGYAARPVIGAYTRNGQLDRNFGKRGLVRAGGLFSVDLGVQRDGRILLAGLSGDPSHFILIRFLADGRLDRSYAGDGVLTRRFAKESEAHAILVQRDGRVVVGGYSLRGGDGAFSEYAWVLMRFFPGP